MEPFFSCIVRQQHLTAVWIVLAVYLASHGQNAQPVVRRFDNNIQNIFVTDDKEAVSIKGTLAALRKTYIEKIQPIQDHFRYEDISTNILREADVTMKPALIFVGPSENAKAPLLRRFIGSDQYDKRSGKSSVTIFDAISDGSSAAATNMSAPTFGYDPAQSILADDISFIPSDATILNDFTIVDVDSYKIDNATTFDQLLYSVRQPDINILVVTPDIPTASTSTETLPAILSTVIAPFILVLIPTDATQSEFRDLLQGIASGAPESSIIIRAMPSSANENGKNDDAVISEITGILHKINLGLLQRRIVNFLRYTQKLKLHTCLLANYLRTIKEQQHKRIEDILANPYRYSIYESCGLSDNGNDETAESTPAGYTVFFGHNQPDLIHSVIDRCKTTFCNPNLLDEVIVQGEQYIRSHDYPTAADVFPSGDSPQEFVDQLSANAQGYKLEPEIWYAMIENEPDSSNDTSQTLLDLSDTSQLSALRPLAAIANVFTEIRNRLMNGEGSAVSYGVDAADVRPYRKTGIPVQGKQQKAASHKSSPPPTDGRGSVLDFVRGILGGHDSDTATPKTNKYRIKQKDATDSAKRSTEKKPSKVDKQHSDGVATSGLWDKAWSMISSEQKTIQKPNKYRLTKPKTHVHAGHTKAASTGKPKLEPKPHEKEPPSKDTKAPPYRTGKKQESSSAKRVSEKNIAEADKTKGSGVFGFISRLFTSDNDNGVEKAKNKYRVNKKDHKGGGGPPKETTVAKGRQDKDKSTTKSFRKEPHKTHEPAKQTENARTFSAAGVITWLQSLIETEVTDKDTKKCLYRRSCNDKTTSHDKTSEKVKHPSGSVKPKAKEDSSSSSESSEEDNEGTVDDDEDEEDQWRDISETTTKASSRNEKPTALQKVQNLAATLKEYMDSLSLTHGEDKPKQPMLYRKERATGSVAPKSSVQSKDAKAHPAPKSSNTKSIPKSKDVKDVGQQSSSQGSKQASGACKYRKHCEIQPATSTGDTAGIIHKISSFLFPDSPPDNGPQSKYRKKDHVSETQHKTTITKEQKPEKDSAAKARSSKGQQPPSRAKVEIRPEGHCKYRRSCQTPKEDAKHDSKPKQKPAVVVPKQTEKSVKTVPAVKSQKPDGHCKYRKSCHDSKTGNQRAQTKPKSEKSTAKKAAPVSATSKVSPRESSVKASSTPVDKTAGYCKYRKSC